MGTVSESPVKSRGLGIEFVPTTSGDTCFGGKKIVFEDVNRPECLADRIEKRIIDNLCPELKELTDRLFMDPGADIHPADTELWLQLLINADKLDHNLHAILFMARAGGAKLVKEKGRFAIRPILGQAWENYDQYMTECRSKMVPYQKEIITLLGGLA
jgi:hypothetical protein